MKANELRIGNFITYLEFETRVNAVVMGTKIQGYVSTFKSGSMPVASFNPIPLTEEWLLKFGFIYNGWNYDFGKFIFHAQGKNEKGEFYNTEFYIKRKDTKCLITFKVQNVHQLQNLYFALTNEELKIN